MGVTRQKRDVDPRQDNGSRGFGLIEAMLAALILTVGIMTLMALFAQAIAATQTAQLDMIARQKAREALESIYTARNTQQLTFEQINNVSNGGEFLSGPQPLREPGADGLVNTGDDGAIESMTKPGPDNLLGTSDDQIWVLDDFRREIRIGTSGADLRELSVIITYRTPLGQDRQVQVRSLMSKFR